MKINMKNSMQHFKLTKKELDLQSQLKIYGFIETVGSGIAEASGLAQVKAGELVRIYPSNMLALALNLSTDKVGLVLCGSERFISEKDIVALLGPVSPKKYPVKLQYFLFYFLFIFFFIFFYIYFNTNFYLANMIKLNFDVDFYKNVNFRILQNIIDNQNHQNYLNFNRIYYITKSPLLNYNYNSNKDVMIQLRHLSLINFDLTFLDIFKITKNDINTFFSYFKNESSSSKLEDKFNLSSNLEDKPSLEDESSSSKESSGESSSSKDDSPEESSKDNFGKLSLEKEESFSSSKDNFPKLSLDDEKELKESFSSSKDSSKGSSKGSSKKYSKKYSFLEDDSNSILDSPYSEAKYSRYRPDLERPPYQLTFWDKVHDFFFGVYHWFFPQPEITPHGFETKKEIPEPDGYDPEKHGLLDIHLDDNPKVADKSRWQDYNPEDYGPDHDPQDYNPEDHGFGSGPRNKLY